MGYQGMERFTKKNLDGRREDSCQLSTILVLGLNIVKVAMQC